MAQTAAAAIPPPINDGGTALDYATGGYRMPTAPISLATPSLAAPFATSLDRATIAPAPTPAAAGTQTPPAVAAILAQNDPSWNAALPAILRHESGNQDVPNYRYDPTHTAGGYLQITDTNWRSYAPKLGIDVSRFPTAMSAPRDWQVAVGKLMHREQGTAPWDIAHGGSLPVGGVAPDGTPLNPALNRMAQTAKRAGEEYHQDVQGDIAQANALMAQYHAAAMAAPAGSRKQDQLLNQEFEASTRAAAALDKLAKTPPTFTPLTMMQRFGSLATLVGIFGGLMSKQPITAALGAAGTAMKAANQQQWDEYHAAFHVWQAQTNTAIAAIRAHSEAINEILANKRLGFDEQQAQLHALATEMQMPLMLDALKKGDIEMQYQIATNLPMIATELEKNQATVKMLGEQIPLLHAKTQLMQAQTGMTADELQMFGGVPSGGAGGTLPSTAPAGVPSSAPAGDAVHAQAAKTLGQGAPPAPAGTPDWAWDAALIYVKTGKMPSLGFGGQMTGLAKITVLSAVPKAMAALGLSATDVPQQWAEYRALEHGQMALGTRAAALAVGIGEAGAAAPAVIQASENVPRTALGPVVNSIFTGTEFQSGDPRIVRFHAALNTFLNAYSRAINPSGRLTDQQQRHAYETLDTAMSKGQIAAGVDQLLQELKYMRAGLGEAVRTVGGLLRNQGGEASPATGYASANAVKAAYHDGKITRDQAAQILRQQFGMH